MEVKRHVQLLNRCPERTQSETFTLKLDRKSSDQPCTGQSHRTTSEEPTSRDTPLRICRFHWRCPFLGRENFYITTSGNFRTQALTNVILEVGADRVLYSVDYPYEDVVEAREWFDRASISESDRMKIARINTQKLFRL